MSQELLIGKVLRELQDREQEEEEEEGGEEAMQTE
jgi:hypothetical protein